MKGFGDDACTGYYDRNGLNSVYLPLSFELNGQVHIFGEFVGVSGT